MKHLIKVNNIETGMNCFFLCVKNIMSWYNRDIKEEELYFISGAFNFEYEYNVARNKNSNTIHPERFGLLKLPFNNLIQNFNKYQIKAHMLTDFNKEILLDHICNTVERNHLSLVMLNTGDLTYEKIYLNNPGRTHTLIIYGIDTEKKYIYVCDPKIRNRVGGISTYKGPTMQNEILESAYLFIWFESSNTLVNKIEIVNIVKEELRSFLVGKRVNELLYTGIMALRRFAEDIICLCDLNDNDFTLMCDNIHFDIKIAIIENLYFLINVIKQLKYTDNEKYENVLKQLEDISTQWDKLALAILKAGILIKKTKINKISEWCNNIVSLHVDVLQNVLAVLNC